MPMPEIISKGAILTRWDNFSKNQNNLVTALGLLKQNNPQIPLVDIGTDSRVAVIEDTPGEAGHLRDDWFYGPNRMWPSVQPIEPIIRQGLIAAIEVALAEPNTPRAGQQPLPIDAYWVCHPGHSSHPAGPSQPPDDHPVEVTVSWSAQQVTFIIHTPDPPIPNPVLTAKEPIFVVKRLKQGESTHPPDKGVPPGEAVKELHVEPSGHKIIRVHP